ncbi:hypothetical protein LINPERHAP2_LOCUS37106 [Linum perenne]
MFRLVGVLQVGIRAGCLLHYRYATFFSWDVANPKRERGSLKDHSSCSVHGNSVQGDGVPLNPPPAVLDYDQIKKLGGVPFEGESTDPQAAVDWLRDMRVVFSHLNATPDERLRYSVFLLRGHARTWWESMTQDDEDPFVMGWEEFKRRFDDEFIPDQWEENKALEFASLKQGDMTVTEYYIKFTRLSRWYQTVPAERENMLKKHFLAGLRTNIQKGVTSFDMTSLTSIKQAALRAEHLDNLGKEE